jgi:2-amino-4-hydroxy-6-hydroxymethyldihydropteridine diphosphokinase
MILTQRVTAYVGLGSNLDDPMRQVTSALQELDRLPETRCVRHSSLYRTRPLGPQDQPDYINAVVHLQTALDPEPLLDALQELEHRHRRLREGPRWGPRTLDLDLLLYDGRQFASDRLVVPHPEMTRRAFVLLPLAEIAPESLEIPGRGDLAHWLERISDDGVQRLQ